MQTKEFEVPNDLFGKIQENHSLNEGITEYASIASSMIATDPDALSKEFSKRFGLGDVLSTGIMISKLLKPKKPITMLQKIQRILFIIGPIILILSWTMLSRFPIIVQFILKVLRILAGIFKSTIGSVLLRLLSFLIKKLHGSVVAILMSIFLLPIGAFFTMIGSLLLKGDQDAQLIIKQHDKKYLKMIWNVFKLLSNAIVEAVPFLKPIITFIGSVFGKIATTFKSGGARAKQAVQQVNQESQELTEGFSVALMLAPIAGFFMKVVKSTKVLGIFGLVFLMIFKFMPGAKSLFMKMPIIGSLITMMQTTGKSLAGRFKLNSGVKQMEEVQKESEELQTTASIVSAVH